MTGNGWDDILEPGEELLWQGQPDPRPDWRAQTLRETLFGLAVTVFSLFWMAKALGIGADASFMGLVFPLMGLPFLVMGLSRAGGKIALGVWRRRHTWYSLTNRRAFIATNLLGRRTLDAYPIGPVTPLDHEEGPPDHIWFATDFVKTAQGSKRRRIGFTHLPDSRAVYDRMRRLQREAL
ncbi:MULTISPECIES: aspartate carbamoyltransferase catalytic subunit [unclassified Meridianimarinicoccus]|uniref:aspartate carbamoyltransferase catalytic subunit n=1 Tax=unclassified Meridianimarinicoccus TaxID=2923344 RepID=UPI0018695B17|nr:aspartate carbamoyltransferase catalytic subunit [Fluviibacterium sp. MJW13]